MAKLTLSDLSNLQNEQSAISTINANSTATEDAMEKTLSRDGTSPNMMLTDIDINSNTVMNLRDAVEGSEAVPLRQLENYIDSLENGAVIDAQFVVLETHPQITDERVLTAGQNISILDAGAGSTVTIGISGDDLNAYENLTTTGLVSRAGDASVFTRTITAPAAGITVTNGDGVAGNPTLVLANDLAAVEGLSTNGLVTRTATDTMTTRTLTAPAAGITITDGDGVSGNPTLVLANDLAAYEGLSTNGIVTRTATDTATTRTITGTANEITVTNGTGVSGDPTISIPSAITLTGKTITGGTFSAPTITVRDNEFTMQDNSDNTKQAQFELSGITAGNTRVLTVPNGTTTLVGTDVAATLTNKTISGSSNTLSNVALSSLATQAAYTFVGNNTGSSAAPTAVDIAALTTKGSPASGDYLILSDQAASGAWKKATVSSVAAGAAVASIDGATGAFTTGGDIFTSSNVIQDHWTTGDVKMTFKSTADTGWVLMNDGTIGNASSGGTTRANADTVNLFTLLWNNVSNTYAAVSGGRGASAAADYAANKTIALPKVLGRSLAGAGAGSGLTSRSLGQTAGSETETPTLAKTAAHNHLQQSISAGGGDTQTNIGGGAVWYIASAGNGFSLNTASAGSGSALNVLDPSVYLNIMIKL